MLKEFHHRGNFTTQNQRRKSFLTAGKRGETGQLRRTAAQEHTTETKNEQKDANQHGKDDQKQQSD